jgi:hypothetical protein
VPSFPPSVDEFKGQFSRDFTYGTGPEFVTDADIQRGLNEAGGVFNPCLGWGSDAQRNTAYLFAAAHMMVLNIQAAGGLSAVNKNQGVNSQGGGTTESKGVGAVNVGYAVPDMVRQSRILSQFMSTNYGQKYLQFILPFLVGNVTIVAGTVNEDLTFAGNVSPLSITTESLAATSLGFNYSQTLVARGGVAPLAWTISDGTLPVGLSLDGATGIISGVTTVVGTKNFTVTVTDRNGTTAFMNYELVVTA